MGTYFMWKFSVTFLLMIVNNIVVSHASEYITVTTESGKVRGIIEDTPGGQVSKFLGIPFAQPPINALRFMPPRPVELWADTLDALEYRDSCMQPEFPFSDVFPELTKNEDCLYLNIITPGNASAISNKAVLVYMYGGGFAYGSTTLAPGSHISTQGDVIYVTIAYRLAIFGQFAYPNLNIPGNLLLLDQIEALKWLKQNIRAFGGNPDDLTVWGQSAGSMSIGFHLLSPLSKGLFKRAIMESGSSLLLAHDNEKKLKALKHAISNMADSAKCPDRDDDAEILKCLQNADPKQLLTATALMQPHIPVVDNSYLYDTAENLLNSGSFDADVDILVGHNSDDGDLFLTLPMNSDIILQAEFNEAALKPKFKFLGTYQSKEFGDEIAAMLQYAYLPEDGKTSTDYRKAAVDVFNDFFKIPILVETLNHAKQNNSNVYMFNFAHRPSWSKSLPFMKAGHIDLTKLLFDPTINLTDVESNLKTKVIADLTHFAKFGTPGQDWPRFTTDTMQYREYESTKTTTKDFLKDQRKLTLWRDIIFKLRNIKQCSNDLMSAQKSQYSTPYLTLTFALLMLAWTTL